MNSNVALYFKLYIMVFIVSFLSISQSTFAFSGSGDGTSGDPYIITSCVQLQEMKDDVTASYTLSGDIDCSDTINWNGGKGFEPVGTSTAPFTGNLDGNNYTISDLSIIRADDTYGQQTDDEEYVGIIGYASHATVSDLHVTNSKIKGWKYVGGIVGYSSNSTITDTVTTGTVQGHAYLGGVVGLSEYSSFIRSSAHGNITGTGNYLGGFAGYAEAIGGPGVYGSVFDKSYALGLASSTGNYVGGFVGMLSGGVKVSNSYARGDVEAYGNVGGFVGSMSANAKVEKSYATGRVTMTGDSFAGGLVGIYAAGDDMFSYNFWDAETSGFSDDSNYSGYTVHATSTSAMKNQFTFINSGWDFASIWGQDNTINDGYPHLYYQSTDTEAPVLTTVLSIPSRVYIADAHYDFTVSESCNIQATVLNVSPASEAEVLITDATNPSGTKSATVTGMRVGSTYSFSFTCVDIHQNVSNSLVVGPFTVIADSESLIPSTNTGSVVSHSWGGGQSSLLSVSFKENTISTPKATSTATSTVRIFTRYLYTGSVGSDVKDLQKLLNSKGFVIAQTGPGSIGNETNRFGPATKAALMKFQKAYNILPATGGFGPKTMVFVNGK